LTRTLFDEQVHHGGVGPQRDRLASSIRAHPELLTADGQVARTTPKTA
jgi:hypothetical protein